MQIYLITFFIALTIYLIMNVLYASSGKVKIKERLAFYISEDSANDIQEQFIKEKNLEQQEKKKQRLQLISKDFSAYILASGLKLTALEFVYMWLGLALIPSSLLIITGGSALTAMALAFIGIALPPLYVNNARKKRKELFNKQLSESLSIMANSIKGGFSFLQSMEGISKDMPPPISTEFAKVLREVHYGISQEDALKHMLERTKSKDLELLVSAVVTSSQVGSNLTEIIETISSTIRDRIRIKQEIKTLTAQGKISGIIVGALPIVLVLAIMLVNPEYYEGFFESSLGKIMLFISIIMELTGFIVIRKIIDIKM